MRSINSLSWPLLVFAMAALLQPAAAAERRRLRLGDFKGEDHVPNGSLPQLPGSTQVLLGSMGFSRLPEALVEQITLRHRPANR